MQSSRIYILLALYLLVLPVLAERPKIGLALAGGGAKGSAQIAVLELLEANYIPVDFIAGTSIGAYVGGLYALGHTAAEIREIMQEANLNRGFSDAIERKDLPYRIKQQKDRFNVPIDIGYRDRAIRIPSGLLYGQTMAEVYRRSVGNIPNFDSYDQLAIPFRAVATDLVTSEVVVLSRGNLVEAMQASATVPGALVPVEIDGRILVDGGLAENLPVSQVRQMGADIIIAVDISAPLLHRESLDNTVSVLRQISHFLTLENIYRQKELLQKDDIYIRPDVDDISPADFSRFQQAYDKGMAAAQSNLSELRRLSIAADEYALYQGLKRDKLAALQRGANQPVVEIELRNRSKTSNAVILETFGVAVGKSISPDELAAAVRRVYALDRFERVHTEFEQRGGIRVLVIEVRGKSWGPNHFAAGLGWEDDFTLDSVINIDFAYTIGNITDNDGEWRNEIGIGTNKSLKTELYLPIGASQRFFTRAIYALRNESRDLFIANTRADVFELTSQQVDLGLGYRWNNAGIIEAGLTYQAGEIENELAQQDDLSYDSPGLYFRIGYDTLDRFSFPSQGSRLTATILYRDESAKGALITGVASETGDYGSTQMLLDWKGATSRDNHGFVGKASLALIDSETDQSIHYVQLGGFLNLSGYHRNALIGNNKIFGAASYQYNLGRSLLGLTGFPLYVGASIEAGSVWLAPDSFAEDEIIAAGSLFLGTDTRLGPAALGFGFSEGDQNSIYFYLGKSI